MLNRFLSEIISSTIKQRIIIVILISLLIFGWFEKIYFNNYWGNIYCTVILLEIRQGIKCIIKKELEGNKGWFRWFGIFGISFWIVLKMSKWRIELLENEIINPIICYVDL